MGSTRYAGYIQVKSTGETLTLPDEAWDRQFDSANPYSTSSTLRDGEPAGPG